MTLTDLPSTMRAVVMRQFGPPDVLRVEDVPTPTPGDGEVIVKVRSVSINRTLDVLVRRDGNNRNVKLLAVLGVDPSGVVVATGPGVRQRRVGDRVATVNFRCGECEYCLAGAEEDCRSELRLGISRWGGYAEYVAVPERRRYASPMTYRLPTPQCSCATFQRRLHWLAVRTSNRASWRS